MKVVVLAGGFGTRLQYVVNKVPKPMADINGTPFLELLLTNMISYGATEFILCVSHLRDKIINYFGTSYKNCSIKYSIEKHPLGTGGAIKQAFDLFNLNCAVVINGDSFVKMDYATFYNRNKNNLLSIVLKYTENASRYGLVEIQGKKIYKFNEKSKEIKSGFINTGVYLISKDIWQYTPNEIVFSFEKDILEKHIKSISASYFKCVDYFIDIGIPESYKKACCELKSIINLSS